MYIFLFVQQILSQNINNFKYMQVLVIRNMFNNFFQFLTGYIQVHHLAAFLLSAQVFRGPRHILVPQGLPRWVPSGTMPRRAARPRPTSTRAARRPRRALPENLRSKDAQMTMKMMNLYMFNSSALKVLLTMGKPVIVTLNKQCLENLVSVYTENAAQSDNCGYKYEQK